MQQAQTIIFFTPWNLIAFIIGLSAKILSKFAKRKILLVFFLFINPWYFNFNLNTRYKNAQIRN